MAAKTLLAFMALLTIQYALAASIGFRWCALQKEMRKCGEFIKYVNKTAVNMSLVVNVECVNTRTTDDCITKIKNNDADLVTLDGGEVYIAGKDNDLVPIVGEQYGEYGVKYYGVAIVQKNNTGFNLTELKGKKSCHTGVRRTAGWNVPVGYLLRTKLMPKAPCDGGDYYDLKAASKFFIKSCAPGADTYLKGDEYSNLCALCDGTGEYKCSKDSSKNRYVGYHGAFKCMAEGKGDVAFVKHTTTEEVVGAGGYGKVDDYVYLCRDGSRIGVDGKSHESCNLGNNPGHAVVTRKGNTDIDNVIKILTTMSDKYGSKQTDWNKFQLFNSTKYSDDDKVYNLLFKDSTTELKAVESNKRNYNAFLGEDYGQNKEAMASCAASIGFRWCALQKEMRKCGEFIKYVNKTAVNMGLVVNVECVNASIPEDCIKKIKNNEADLVTLDGGDVYIAGKDNDLVPIVGEQYGEYGVKYYGVAIVKKNNKGFNFKELKGKKSCHTGVRRTAGWNVPVGYLLRTKLMPKAPCDGGGNYDLKAASKFFIKSCAPGADTFLKGDEYSNLCALCNGTGNDKCSKDSSKNGYVGYHGAFKCMAEGKGDVAFVKHTTTEEVVGAGGYGKVEDYEYLCRNGSRIGVGGKSHESCNLGNNPGHAVVTREGNTDIDDVIKILTTMSDKYGSKQTDWNKFQLFNSTKYSDEDKVYNLLFKDSTTELKAVKSNKRNYNAFLGEDYGQNKEARESCDGAKTTESAPTSVSTPVSPIAELVLLIGLLAAAQRLL